MLYIASYYSINQEKWISPFFLGKWISNFPLQIISMIIIREVKYEPRQDMPNKGGCLRLD